MNTVYVVQYKPADDRRGWLDGGGPWTVDEAEARKRLAWCREDLQQKLFPREWRLVKRTTTEEVLDA